MIPSHQPGVPFPLGPHKPDLIIGEVGDVAHADGCQVLLSKEYLIFNAAVNGGEIHMGIDLCQVLAAIGKYNHTNES